MYNPQEIIKSQKLPAKNTIKVTIYQEFRQCFSWSLGKIESNALYEKTEVIVANKRINANVRK